MIVAMVGRPNVGKSSLFNRLVGSRKALVWNQAGVTRDLLKGEWKSDRGTIEVWDMAGWGKFGTSLKTLPSEWRERIDAFVFVVDGSEPLTNDDHECLNQLRRLNRPFVICVNKSDKKTFQIHSHEIHSFVKAPAISVSVEKKIGLESLADELIHLLPNATDASNTVTPTSRLDVVILGRPNAGKSSLLNQLAGESRAAVSAEAGTTRDVLEHVITDRGIEWHFIDTAGIRKKAKIYGRNADPLEIFSIEKALGALEKADLAVMLVEANKEGRLTTQDKKLLNLIRETLTPTLLVVNKWDLYRKDWDEKKYRSELRSHLDDLNFLPILFISAKTGFHLGRLTLALKQINARRIRIPTPKLNRWLQQTMKSRPPRVAKKGRTNRLTRTQTQYVNLPFMVQISERPMTFQVFANAPQAIAEEDKRFLTKSLRAEFHLEGIPLKFVYRKK